MTHHPSFSGEKISGTYRQTVQLSSGRFAMIENGLGFQLVPWSAAIENKRGQEISGVVRSSASVDWQIGRSRGIEI